MAESDRNGDLMKLLIGGCIATVGAMLAIGGQFMLAGHSDERETLRQLSALDAKMESMGMQMAALQRVIASVDQTSMTIAVLQVRVNSTEKVVEKHEEVLKELQHYRVPLGMQVGPQTMNPPKGK